MTRQDGCLIWLSLAEGLGFTRTRALLERFSGAEGVWAAKEAQWAELVGPALAGRLRAARDPAKINDYVSSILKRGIRILTLEGENYPSLLAQTPDAPYVLYAMGDLSLAERPCAAIVGSRSCSSYGARVAAEFASAIAGAGGVVVSGLALGIDAAAHRTALNAGGGTIAVLGNGIELFYPPENEALQREIAQKGLLLSEYPPHFPVRRWQFPVRNRIIAGLSRAVLLPEAGENSGALSTAESAMEYGRECFTVPGQIFSPYSFETNRLLKTSAQVALEPADLLPALGLSQSPKIAGKALKTKGGTPTLSNDERPIYDALRAQALSFDELAQLSALELSALNSLLTMMEMKGIIIRMPGRNYELNV
ncbi:MAG: DNA-processing protein DprA [Christensenellaceae bacterium]|jgi:DNA processing protein|nr:DNA-processing protein DprA [Christensenellaceae bacterium]